MQPTSAPCAFTSAIITSSLWFWYPADPIEHPLPPTHLGISTWEAWQNSISHTLLCGLTPPYLSSSRSLTQAYGQHSHIPKPVALATGIRSFLNCSLTSPFQTICCFYINSLDMPQKLNSRTPIHPYRHYHG